MMRSSNGFARPRTSILTVLIASSILVGCHRQFYRKQADGEVNCLIDEKASHVARPPNALIRVDLDRRSRMFNPFDLDFQPMPLDDPASYQYMQCVDGRRSYPMWEAAGITNTAESPDWWQFLPLDEDGVLVLNQENAVRIALLHSTQYQEQIEQLYFAALDVTAQRFEFETQFFGGADTFVQTFRRGPTDVGIGDRGLSMQRRFATGADLVVNLANDIVWNVSGSGSLRTTSSFLDFTFIQPLLRNAGRDKVLEGLTQSERELLASVRAFERFRRAFYLNITVGSQANLVVATSVGNISVNQNGIGVGGGSGRGFLGLLQRKLQIRNSEENIARQTENLLILEDTLIELLTTIPDNAAEDIVRQRLQVAQTRASLLRAQSSLVGQQAGFQLSVDQYLRTLGLPPYICVRLDDPILNQFELIDRNLLTRREELSALRTNVGQINVSIIDSAEFKLDPDTGLPVSNMEWTPQLAQSLETLRSEMEPLEEFTRDLIATDLQTIFKDIEDFASSLQERKRQNENLRELYRTEQASICSLLGVSELDVSIFEIGDLDTLSAELTESLAKLDGRLQGYLSRIDELQAAFEKLQSEGQTSDPIELARRIRDEIILASQDLVAELGDDVLMLQLIQARARTESVVLPQIDITPDVALEIARRNRRDWANARASLVDSWRQIEVIADDLESTLDVEISGGVGSTRLNPGGLTKSGDLNVGLRWDAPITRLLERNAYRAILIRYEQDKRRYYNFEDSVWQVLRAEVRQLQANRLTFELGRQAVGIAAEQIELNADIRALNDARGRSAGPTAARDAISALADLLDAQNGLLDIFVNYETVRRGLDLDMGTMELTPEGLWIDPGQLSPELLLSLPGTTVGGMIECECNDCGLPFNPLPEDTSYNEPMLGTSDSGGMSVLSEEEAMGEVPADWVPIEGTPIDSSSLVPVPVESYPIDANQGSLQGSLNPLPESNGQSIPSGQLNSSTPGEPQYLPLDRADIDSL